MVHLVEAECVLVKSSSSVTLPFGLCSGETHIRYEVAARQVRSLGLNVTLANEWSPVAFTDFQCSSNNGKRSHLQ